MIPVRPGKIIGIGRNYAAHAKELGNEVPSVPILFFKPTTALIGAGDPIRLPAVSRQVEFEAEIGVVIGTRLHDADIAQAERGIGGYTCVNGFDTFCPVGPEVRDGLDWRELEVICRVNGRERQRGRATEMHFSIPELVSFISGIMTLEPGDLIATGTPAGTGPLTHGDVVEVEIPGIGVLSNPVQNGERK